jgi:hypothetical protein
MLFLDWISHGNASANFPDRRVFGPHQLRQRPPGLFSAGPIVFFLKERPSDCHNGRPPAGQLNFVLEKP